MDHLRLRALALIEALGETGSLHKAARRLNVSQPALTVELREVEHVMGARLFDRTPQGLTPTDMGSYMVRQAGLILADLRRAQEEFTAGHAGRSLLRVGVLPLLMLEIVARALAQLHEALPTLSTEFTEGAAAELLKGLSDGTLDIVVGRMLPEFAHESDLRPTYLFTESFCIVAGTHHSLAIARRQSR